MLLHARSGEHFFWERNLDILLSTATAYYNLLNTEYEFVLGRKNTTVRLRVVFHKNHFYHLAGLHYLTDIQNLKGDREVLYNKILNAEITSAEIEKSVFFSTIEARMKALSLLENLFDSDSLVFKYNATSKAFSVIEADYLMENYVNDNKIFTFLAKNPDGNYYCRSFFPMDKQDFSIGQTNWTVLLKKKINKSSKTEQELYRHKNYRGD